MTDMIDFPLADGPVPSLRFAFLDRLDALPAEAGLYVLMGTRPGQAPRPLAFGYADDLARQVPRSADFAAALRDGFHSIGIAKVPEGCDGASLAHRLGHDNGAPMNMRREALQAIEEARLPGGGLHLAAE